MPIALVSLVDTDRQWFKSKFGLETTETSRDVSFCAHAILQDDILVVQDTHLDSRFAANPLVTWNPTSALCGRPVVIAGGLAPGHPLRDRP
ncbi:hypothetical protein [Synechococcus sp. J7-Johnson]|uniref:hypothetical protein n=1 Tax=Synechococcus sp. J7-Johnson TaxID=2823737 RepID=UPI0037D9A632